MTPSARLSAAIEILDFVLLGSPAEKALSNWARRSRFAGSKDRAAVRDHVFDALRCKRSFAALGGDMSGRGIILGMLRASGADPTEMFTGVGHAPEALNDSEAAHDQTPQGFEALDCPDWLAPQLQQSLGDDFEPVCKALQKRAPVFLRVNTSKSTRDGAISALQGAEIATLPHALSDTALMVTENPRKVKLSAPYLSGIVELQDAASQALVDMVPLAPDLRVLDYCAGGGGKVLAMAARQTAKYFAHDIDADRMGDLPLRAERAGASITLLDTDEVAAQAQFDRIICDVPCSGSGSWRRSPAGKWDLQQDRLTELCEIQVGILTATAPYLAPDGVLIYMTCSLLDVENKNNIDEFLADYPTWKCVSQHSFSPLTGGDGFFTAHLTRS